MDFYPRLHRLTSRYKQAVIPVARTGIEGRQANGGPERARLSAILTNQARIVANQETILANQSKLDKLAADVAGVLANQGTIQENQH